MTEQPIYPEPIPEPEFQEFPETYGTGGAGPMATPAKKDNKTLIIILVVVAVVVLLCCCVFFVGPMIFGDTIQQIFEDIVKNLEGSVLVFVS